MSIFVDIVGDWKLQKWARVTVRSTRWADTQMRNRTPNITWFSQPSLIYTSIRHNEKYHYGRVQITMISEWTRFLSHLSLSSSHYLISHKITHLLHTREICSASSIPTLPSLLVACTTLKADPGGHTRCNSICETQQIFILDFFFIPFLAKYDNGFHDYQRSGLKFISVGMSYVPFGLALILREF